MKVEKGLLYTKDHEWVKVDGNIATLGIADYAQEHLGDIVYVELPEIDDELAVGDAFASVESVKAVEDLYSAVTGTVIERNDTVVDSPEQVASDPYGEGWLLKVRVNDSSEADDALSADEYRAQVEGE